MFTHVYSTIHELMAARHKIQHVLVTLVGERSNPFEQTQFAGDNKAMETIVSNPTPNFRKADLGSGVGVGMLRGSGIPLT